MLHFAALHLQLPLHMFAESTQLTFAERMQRMFAESTQLIFAERTQLIFVGRRSVFYLADCLCYAAFAALHWQLPVRILHPKPAHLQSRRYELTRNWCAAAPYFVVFAASF